MNDQLDTRAPGVLVVDHEVMVREVLDLGLRREGFCVWLAEDGREALEVFARHAGRIDVVLLEVGLPGPDGPQTLAALRRLHPGVRCCFMSGYASDYTEEELLGLRVTLLNKPFGTTEVARVLWRLLGRPYQDPHVSEECPSILSWRQWGRYDRAPTGHS